MSDTEDLSPDPVDRKTTVNLAQYHQTTRELVDATLAVAKGVFGNEAVKKLAGSGSVSVDGKVIAKVMPQVPGPAEYVLLGVSTDFAPQTWVDMPATFDGPFVVVDSQFHFFLLPRTIADAQETAACVFRELKTRLASG